MLLGSVLLATNAAGQPPAPALPHNHVNITPIAVFGEDQRMPLPQSRAALAGRIGVLALGDQTFCTAFCVSSGVIATASHCLLGTEQTPGPDLERVTFNLGERERQSSRLAGEDRTAIRAELRSGTSLLRITPPIAAVKDWAVVRLAKPVCRAGGLPLSTLPREKIEEHAHAGDVYQVAMHRDVAPAAIVIGAPCNIMTSFPQAGPETIAQDFIEPHAILMHTCDTGPGSSGSPLLIDGSNGPEVIGINVGTYVLSRTSTSTSSASSAARASEAIANTAIEVSRFRSAVEAFSLETSAIDARGHRHDKTH